jgi:hypothetical protein
MKLQAKKRREHHERAIEEAKRMAIEKNYKGLKAQLFGGRDRHMLNQMQK